MLGDANWLLPHFRLALGGWAWGLLLVLAIGVFCILALAAQGLLRRTLIRLGLLRSRSLASNVIIGCVLVTVIPGLAAAITLAEKSTARYIRIVSERQVIRTSTLASRVDRDIDMHVAAIETFAELTGVPRRLTPSLTHDELESFRRRHPSFLTVLAADVNGTVVARAGQAIQRLNSGTHAATVSDRDYFREPLRTGISYVSGLFRGRGIGTDPIVAISAPLRDHDGNIIGVVEGSLNIAGWARDLYATSVEPGLDLLVTDQLAYVVHADPLWDRQPLDNVRSDPRFINAVAQEGAPQFVPAQSRSDPHLTTAATSRRGWHVLAALPLALIRERVLAELQIVAGGLALATLLALLIGLMLARQVMRPIERLSQIMSMEDETAIASSSFVSRAAPAEVRHLYQQFAQLRTRLTKVIDELRSTVNSREAVIAERTTELAEKNANLTVLNMELDQAARTDPVTGIANRRAFDERLGLLWQMLGRLGHPLSLVIIDVDHFKQFNDRYGHANGDNCLRRVAHALARASTRSTDLVARIGGEEFAMILIGDIKGAAHIAEQARSTIAALEIAHADAPTGLVTASFGVACMIPAGDTRLMVEAADRALYAAKRDGRNRVSLADWRGAWSSANEPDAAAHSTAPQVQENLGTATR